MKAPPPFVGVPPSAAVRLAPSLGVAGAPHGEPRALGLAGRVPWDLCVRIWVVRYVEKINRNKRSELSVSLQGVSPAAVTCATKGILWPGRPQQKVTRDANPPGRTQCSHLPAGLLCPQSSVAHARSQAPLLRVRKVMLSLEVNFRTFPLP